MTVTPARVALAALAGAYLVSQLANQVATQDDADGTSALDYVDPIGAVLRTLETTTTTYAMSDTNVRAFLAMISAAEGTNRGADPYRICYGYRHTIRDLSDHPAITGEWRGEPLDSLGPAYAGKWSTAAGRYQIIKPTWVAARRALGLGDFSAQSQDLAAVHLIARRGALDAVRQGRVADAIALCRAEWASLPGAGYGQPERKLATLKDAFVDAGGVLA